MISMLQTSILDEHLGQELCNEMYRMLKNKFGFNQFRHRQKHAVIAALLGYDCFILMPTGLLTFLLSFTFAIEFSAFLRSFI